MRTVKYLYTQKGTKLLFVSLGSSFALLVVHLNRRFFDEEWLLFFVVALMINIIIWLVYGAIYCFVLITKHAKTVRLKRDGVCYHAIVDDVHILHGKSGSACYAECSYVDANIETHIVKSEFFSTNEPWHEFNARVYVNPLKLSDYIVELYINA